MTIHNSIKLAFAGLKAPEDTAERILGNAEKKPKAGTRFKRPIAAVAAACAGLLFCTLTVLAATMPGWLENITTFLQRDAAPILQPVGGSASAENQGIRVDVLSALADDHGLLMELLVTDITESGRFTEKTEMIGGVFGSGSVSGIYITDYSPNVCKAYAYSSNGNQIQHDNVHYQIDHIYFDGPPTEILEGELQVWDLFFSVEKTQIRYLESVSDGNGQDYYNISLSAIGFYLNSNDRVDIQSLQLQMKNGQTIVFRTPQKGDRHSISAFSSSDRSSHTGIVFFYSFIALDDVASVTLNGIEIPLK